VSPERVGDRLDVKNCLLTPGRKVEEWTEAGFAVIPLSAVAMERVYTEEEVITKDYPEEVRVLVVRYEGIAEAGNEILPAEGSYARLYPVRCGDIVISNIAASHGSIAVVPLELDGTVVSSEYTVLQPREGYDPVVLQLILRSPEIRSDILLTASGANRTRARWESIKHIKIPYPAVDVVSAIRALADEADEAKRRAAVMLERAREQTEKALLLRSEEATTILTAFKPPK
jgi:type I restriction enzyme M protein